MKYKDLHLGDLVKLTVEDYAGRYTIKGEIIDLDPDRLTILEFGHQDWGIKRTDILHMEVIK